MKALVFSDLQATDGHQRLFSNPTTSLQLWRVNKLFEVLQKIYLENNCDCVWELGDLTDDRNSISLPTLEAVSRGMNSFPDSEFNFKIVGNHEFYLRDASISSGCLYRHKFKVFDKPGVIQLGDTTILMAPFPGNDEELANWIRTNSRQSSKIILLGHFQVIGCQMDSGVSISGIPKQALQKIQLGLLGHVHKAQTVLPNIYYVGSPFQQNFGEANEQKRVAVVDTDSLSVKWITLDCFPRYATVHVNEFVRIASADAEDRYKVVVNNQEEAEKFYAHPLSNRAEAVYEYEQSVRNEESESLQPQLSLDFLLMKYVKLFPPTAKGIALAEDEMLSYGKEIATAVD